MKRAAIYRRGNRLYIMPEHVTTSWLGVIGEPIIAIEWPVDPNRLGEVILQSMQVSREGIEEPASMAHVQKPLLEKVGVKTWRTFDRGAQYISVWQDGDVCHIERWEPAPDGGHVSSEDGGSQCTCNLVPDQIGEIVNKYVE